MNFAIETLKLIIRLNTLVVGYVAENKYPRELVQLLTEIEVIARLAINRLEKEDS